MARKLTDEQAVARFYQAANYTTLLSEQSFRSQAFAHHFLYRVVPELQFLDDDNLAVVAAIVIQEINIRENEANRRTEEKPCEE